MTVKQLNVSYLERALSQGLGVKGPFPLEIHGEILPTVQVVSLENSPYSSTPTPVIAVGAKSAVVARNAYVGARCGTAAILEVMQVIITTGAAGLGTFSGGLVTPTAYAADFLETFAGPMTDANGRLSPTNLTIENAPHELIAGTRVNFNWTQIFTAYVGNNATVTVDIPQRVFLRPDGPLFFVEHGTVNTAVGGVSIMARSWPLEA
jgi:hypothetical protein